MQYLLMLMLHSDITLVTRNSILKKPRIVHEDSENGQSLATMAETVSGMLTAETSRSAAESPRMNMLVTVCRSRDLQIIIHSEILPLTATVIMRHIMTASMIALTSIRILNWFLVLTFKNDQMSLI